MPTAQEKVTALRAELKIAKAEAALERRAERIERRRREDEKIADAFSRFVNNLK